MAKQMLDWELVPSALCMARKYDSSGLKQDAEETMEAQQLDFSNFCEFLTIADRFGVASQRKRGVQWYHEHKSQIGR